MMRPWGLPRRKRHRHSNLDVEQFQDVKLMEDKVKAWTHQRWEERWKAFQVGNLVGKGSPATREALLTDRTDHYSGLRRAESSMAVQLRPEQIDPNHFLHKMRVPTLRTAGCVYDWTKHHVIHLLLFWPKLDEKRKEQVVKASMSDVRRILTQPQGIRTSARWVIGTGWLE